MRHERVSYSRRAAAIAVAASLALAGIAPAPAEPLPRPESLVGSEAMVRELSEMLVSGEADAGARLERLDAMLAELRQPNELRGLVQHLRAIHLLPMGREAAAREAIEESVRLLRGYSAPLFVASYLELSADRAAEAADYFIRASEIDPHLARGIMPYDLRNLIGRLNGSNDHRRLGRLAERLIAIDWQGRDVELRSRLALEAVRARAAAGDVAAARDHVTRLVAPAHLQALLLDNRYRELWPDLETWGGSRQERQWPPYLAELKAQFATSGEPVAALRYAEALRAAGHYRTIAREIGPLFDRSLDPQEDYDLLWVAPMVADALARLGRWAEIEPMFDRAARTWPLGSDANALNIAGNRARFMLLAGDARASADALDRVIEDAGRHGGQVSRNALATMHLHRACALQEAGREHETVASAAEVLGAGDPTLAAGLHLCFGQHAAARAALIAGLANEATRSSVLWYAQRSDAPPVQSDYGRRMAARLQALKEDASLLRAVAQYGRVLPHSPSAGAPPEL